MAMLDYPLGWIQKGVFLQKSNQFFYLARNSGNVRNPSPMKSIWNPYDMPNFSVAEVDLYQVE